MKIIVGNTGLVGKTICEQETFDLEFNTKNIQYYSELVSDGGDLFLSCLPATKWLVNHHPLEDRNNIDFIIETISKKRYGKITLISTIDVYNTSPLKSDEDFIDYCPFTLNYGSNRRYFELSVMKSLIYDDLKIIRLPALFNKHIKKNVLFDLINNNNINQINSNSCYQWYNLNNLSADISFYTENYPKENSFNLFGEPIDTEDILSFFPQHKDNVKTFEMRVVYDYTTKFSNSRYITTKDKTLSDIKTFIDEFSFK